LLILFFCMLSFCCSLSTIQFQKWFQERPHRPTGQGLLPFPATLPTRPNRPIRLPNIKPKWPNRPIIMLSLLLRAVGPLLPPYPKWPCPKWIYPKLAYPNYPLAGLVEVAIDLTMSTLPTLPMPTPSLLPPLSTDIMEILDRNSKCPKQNKTGIWINYIWPVFLTKNANLWFCVLPKICPNIYNTLFLIFIRFCSCTQFDDEILSMKVTEIWVFGWLIFSKTVDFYLILGLKHAQTVILT